MEFYRGSKFFAGLLTDGFISLKYIVVITDADKSIPVAFTLRLFLSHRYFVRFLSTKSVFRRKANERTTLTAVWQNDNY